MPNGSLDPSFDGDGKATLDLPNSFSESFEAVAIDKHNRIVVTGTLIGSTGPTFQVIVARFLDDGSPDDSFGDNGVAYVAPTLEASAADLAVTKLGRIVVVGTSSSSAAGSRMLVAQLTNGGNLDTDFANDGLKKVAIGDEAAATSVMASTSITVGGVGGTKHYGPSFIRLKANGKLDEGFGKGGKRTLDLGSPLETSISGALGEPFIASSTIRRSTGHGYQIVLARIRTNGKLEKSFGRGGVRRIGLNGSVDRAAPVLDLGRIVVAGSVRGRFALLRFDHDGKLDPTFSDDGKMFFDLTPSTDTAYGLAVQADGRYVIAGAAGVSSGSPLFGLARLLAR